MKKIIFDYYDWDEFEKFLDSLSDKEAAKFIAIIQKIEEHGLLVAERQEWIKKLEKNLYEIRSKFSSNSHRAIYFQFKDSRYIITHGFKKKRQKTAIADLELARRRRQIFLESEKKKHDET